MTKPYIISENEILMEQYKIYVEMADRVSARRSQTNKFYIALLTALLAILSTITEKNFFSEHQLQIYFLLSFIGISLNYVWYKNLKSYRQLNRAKYKIVQEIEQQLPFHCYEKEWELLGKGEDSEKYNPFTKIEANVPIILVIPYAYFFIYGLFKMMLNVKF